MSVYRVFRISYRLQIVVLLLLNTVFDPLNLLLNLYLSILFLSLLLVLTLLAQETD